MILQKVLATGRAMGIRKVLSPNSDVLSISRRNKGVYTPPTEKVSTTEQVILGTIISVSILSIPAWVMLHIREYGGVA